MKKCRSYKHKFANQLIDEEKQLIKFDLIDLMGYHDKLEEYT